VIDSSCTADVGIAALNLNAAATAGRGPAIGMSMSNAVFRSSSETGMHFSTTPRERGPAKAFLNGLDDPGWEIDPGRNRQLTERRAFIRIIE
jgi:hypothetical protein